MEMETGVVAKRYGQLESERDTFLERGREAAKLTIPTLLPEEGHSSSSYISYTLSRYWSKRCK